MNMTQITYGLSIVATGLICACGGSEGPPVAGTPTNDTQSPVAQKSVDAAIVEKVVNARCDHEETCKNIGAGQKYSERKVCGDQLRGDMANDLNGYKCPRGIDSEALDRCMAAIKAEECSHPFDSLNRHEKCKDSALCLN